MGLPLWREPEDSAPRRSTTRSPAHPVIARSPIAHVPSPRRTTLSPRRRQLREARERRLRQISELFENDDSETPRASNIRTIFDSPVESYEPDMFRDALHTRTYTPPTQDARALDQVVSYLTSREPLLNRDSPEAHDREQSAERNPESTSSPRLVNPDELGRSRDTPPWEGFEDRERLRHATGRLASLPLSQATRAPTRPSVRTMPHYRRALTRPHRRGIRRSGRNVDGLGDRDRSLSPEGDGLWDNLLTTLAPDPQPPSVGSSFASTTASTSTAASQNPTIPSSRTSITSPGEAVEPPCDPVSELEGLFAERDWDRQDWQNSIRSDVEVLEANPTSSPDDLSFISSMHAIIRRLASREDIPDEWWERAGLSRSMSWEGDN